MVEDLIYIFTTNADVEESLGQCFWKSHPPTWRELWNEPFPILLLLASATAENQVERTPRTSTPC